MTPLREEDAHPADPEPGFGWEKLYAEQLCSNHWQDYHFEVRIVRFHNVCGPLGTYEGGRARAPAAICRKVALAHNWLITINGLVDLICSIAGKQLTKKHDLSKPQGVRGRNSDNSRLRGVLGRERSVTLEQGLAIT